MARAEIGTASFSGRVHAQVGLQPELGGYLGPEWAQVQVQRGASAMAPGSPLGVDGYLGVICTWGHVSANGV